MAIVPQHADATADGSGDAVFMFPDVPQGELWTGTTQIAGAPSTAVGVVTGGGEYFGEMFGPGAYGPWTCGATRRLAISASGLTPGVQYQAVWHADDKGEQNATYPAPITPTTVVGGGVVDIGNFPPIQTVDGTVDVGNFPATQTVAGAVTVTGTVTADPALVAVVKSGQVAMTGSIVNLPSNAASQGVALTAPASNAGPIAVGAALVAPGTGMILSPGQAPTPVLPVANSSALHAIGTSGDVLSFLVL